MMKKIFTFACSTSCFLSTQELLMDGLEFDGHTSQKPLVAVWQGSQLWMLPWTHWYY